MYDSPGKGSENVTFVLRPEWELTIQALQEESARRGQSLKALRGGTQRISVSVTN